MTFDTDILVIGGGIAGLAATARLSAAGAHVTCVDPAPAAAPGSDLRTTAFLAPAIATLGRSGAWGEMEARGAPLWIMRIVDAGGARREVRETCDFRADEMQTAPFGWNIPNRVARRALIGTIKASANANLASERTVEHLLRRSTSVIARLSDGQSITARLAVAADGRDSTIRAGAGIGMRRWHYGQRALVFAVTHDVPHEGVSTEIHRTGGPLTLVPMPDHRGRPCSSVVWMMPGAKADARLEISNETLAADLTTETMGLFGVLRIAGPRAAWPIIGQAAHALTTERLALIGETAHVIPPIGAQGLNMSLADIETLAGLVEDAIRGGKDPGETALLERFARLRWPDMAARIAGVDTLNRFAQTDIQPLRDLRRLGLKAIHDTPPLRRLAMQLGLGARLTGPQ